MKGKEFCKQNIGKKYRYRGENVRIVGWNDDLDAVIIALRYGWLREFIGVFDHVDFSILKETDSLLYASADELKEITKQNKKNSYGNKKCENYD